jgi:hypothetical protein
MSQQETKTSKSAQLYAMRDGLSQISWLCQVLEHFAKLHKRDVERKEDDDSTHTRFFPIQKSILDQFGETYKGTHGNLPNIFKCVEQLSEDVRTFANETRHEFTEDEDTWGIRFLHLLDAFHEILNRNITTFLPRNLANTADFDMYAETAPEMQEKLVDLLQFTYDGNTKMGSSANKQRIQRDCEWTVLCIHCVWVTTAWDNDKLGPLDTLYADSMSQKEELEQQVREYLFGCTLDAQETIHNRRDAKIHAPAGPAVKRAPKKAKPGDVDPGQHTQMTELLGELRACMQ